MRADTIKALFLIAHSAGLTALFVVAHIYISDFQMKLMFFVIAVGYLSATLCRVVLFCIGWRPAL